MLSSELFSDSILWPCPPGPPLHFHPLLMLVDMHRNPFLAVKNPTALIRSRITEKRIFEARFLCRQLGVDIDPQEKTVLQQQLDNLVVRVEKLRQQAREHAEAGQRTAADAVYRDIELIAIDVPGLREERAKLAGAEPLVARITGRTVLPESESAPKPVTPRAKVDQAEEKHEPGAVSSSFARIRLSPVRLIVVGVGIFSLVVLAGLFFLLRSMPPPVPMVQEESDHIILIRPLAVPPAAMVTKDNTKIEQKTSLDSAASGASTGEEAVVRPRAVSVGALQIEETGQ
jgi:hypothetical protein